MSTESISRWIHQMYGMKPVSLQQSGASRYKMRDDINAEWELVTGELVLPEKETVRWIEAENDVIVKRTKAGEKLTMAGEKGRAYMYQKKTGTRESCEKNEAKYRQLGTRLAEKHRSWHEKIPLKDEKSIQLAEETAKAERRQMHRLLPKGQTIIRQSIDSLFPVIQQAAGHSGRTGFVFREVEWQREYMERGVLLPGAMPGVHVSLYDLAALLRSILLSFSGEEDYQPFARMVFNELLAGYDGAWSIPLSSLQQFANVLEWHDLHQYALLWQKDRTAADAAVIVREQIRLEHRLPLLEI